MSRDMSAGALSAAGRVAAIHRTMERITLSTDAVGASVAKVVLAARAPV